MTTAQPRRGSHGSHPKTAKRFRDLLAAERRSPDLYAGLADATTRERREILTELAAVERRHAAHCADKLTQLGQPVPHQPGGGCAHELLTWLARRFSLGAVLPYLERAEHADAGLYQDDPEVTPAMAVDERSHARVVSHLRKGEEEPGSAIA